MRSVGTPMTYDELLSLGTGPPGRTIAYGKHPLQFGELSLPDTPGPHPVIVNVHGGVWLAAYSIEHTRKQAKALADSGFAVWNIEYRRIGDDGGGWPGTFEDVAAAADHVRQLAGSYALDLSRIGLMGHSAGGHLALWLASRHRLPEQSPLYRSDPLLARGVVALAPASELAQLYDKAIYDGVVGKLVGGSPTEFPDRYRWTTPARLAPLGIPQTLIVGQLDDEWGWIGRVYQQAAESAGDRQVKLIVLEGVGHFELIAPHSAAWPIVLRAAHEMLDRPGA